MGGHLLFFDPSEPELSLGIKEIDKVCGHDELSSRLALGRGFLPGLLAEDLFYLKKIIGYWCKLSGLSRPATVPYWIRGHREENQQGINPEEASP